MARLMSKKLVTMIFLCIVASATAILVAAAVADDGEAIVATRSLLSRRHLKCNVEKYQNENPGFSCSCGSSLSTTCVSGCETCNSNTNSCWDTTILYRYDSWVDYIAKTITYTYTSGSNKGDTVMVRRSSRTRCGVQVNGKGCQCIVPTGRDCLQVDCTLFVKAGKYNTCTGKHEPISNDPIIQVPPFEKQSRIVSSCQAPPPTRRPPTPRPPTPSPPDCRRRRKLGNILIDALFGGDDDDCVDTEEVPTPRPPTRRPPTRRPPTNPPPTPRPPTNRPPTNPVTVAESSTECGRQLDSIKSCMLDYFNDRMCMCDWQAAINDCVNEEPDICDIDVEAQVEDVADCLRDWYSDGCSDSDDCNPPWWADAYGCTGVQQVPTPRPPTIRPPTQRPPTSISSTNENTASLPTEDAGTATTPSSDIGEAESGGCGMELRALQLCASRACGQGCEIPSELTDCDGWQTTECHLQSSHACCPNECSNEIDSAIRCTTEYFLGSGALDGCPVVSSEICQDKVQSNEPAVPVDTVAVTLAKATSGASMQHRIYMYEWPRIAPKIILGYYFVVGLLA